LIWRNQCLPLGLFTKDVLQRLYEEVCPLPPRKTSFVNSPFSSIKKMKEDQWVPGIYFESRIPKTPTIQNKILGRTAESETVPTKFHPIKNQSLMSTLGNVWRFNFKSGHSLQCLININSTPKISYRHENICSYTFSVYNSCLNIQHLTSKWPTTFNLSTTFLNDSWLIFIRTPLTTRQSQKPQIMGKQRLFVCHWISSNICSDLKTHLQRRLFQTF
jgi:hypothetical protein